MKCLKFRILMIAVIAMSMAVSAQAQQSYRTFKDWYGWFELGYVWPQGDYGDATDSDWTIGGGVSYVPHNSTVSYDFGLDYHDNSIKNFIVDPLDADSGTVEVWSLSAAMRWTPNTNSDNKFYFKAGLSYNWVDARLSNFTTVPGWICDPWYWWICAPGWVPGEYVTARHSTSDWGYFGGIGVDFAGSGSTSFYIELQYKVINTEVDTQYMPLLLGFRF